MDFQTQRGGLTMWSKNRTQFQLFIFLMLTTAGLGMLSILLGSPTVQAAPLPSQVGQSSSANYLNQNSLPLLQVSSAITIYLPVVRKAPTPPPSLYYDDFAGPNIDWVTGSSGNCYFSYINSRYKIELKASNLACWGPGPSNSQFKYGLFETLAFSDNNNNTAYGLYLNGKGGGEQYLFVVKPNDSGCSSGKGRFEFYRNQSNNSSKKLDECSSAIKRGSGSGAANLLQAGHTSDGVIRLYANNTLLGTYTDSNQLTGTGTGVYSRTGSGQNIVRYEYFAVYNP